MRKELTAHSTTAVSDIGGHASAVSNEYPSEQQGRCRAGLASGCFSPKPRTPGIANGSGPTGCPSANRGPDSGKHRSTYERVAISAAAVGVILLRRPVALEPVIGSGASSALI